MMKPVADPVTPFVGIWKAMKSRENIKLIQRYVTSGKPILHVSNEKKLSFLDHSVFARAAFDHTATSKLMMR